MTPRKAAFVTLALVVAVPASYASYCGILIWNGNFHVVEEAQVYRSAELSKAEFTREMDTLHIRSVLNLRGPNPDKAWYRDEIAATEAHGAVHYDVGISARKPVSAEKIEKIIAVLRDAPKPILIHCQSGSDRTGFASALYRYVIKGDSADAAARQLTLLYGHFPYLFSKTRAMDESADAYFANHPRAANFRPDD